MNETDFLRKVYLYIERYEYYLRHDNSFDDNQVERNMWLADSQRVREKIIQKLSEIGEK